MVSSRLNGLDDAAIEGFPNESGNGFLCPKKYIPSGHDVIMKKTSLTIPSFNRKNIKFLHYPRNGTRYEKRNSVQK